MGIDRQFKSLVISSEHKIPQWFFCETLLDEARLGSIRDSLQFGHHHGVSKISHGGGLALFWKKDFHLSIESSFQNHVDVVINKDKENAWHFTGIYRALETHLRMETWNLIRELKIQFSLPWLCGGDFNELLKTALEVKRLYHPDPSSSARSAPESIKAMTSNSNSLLMTILTWECHLLTLLMVSKNNSVTVAATVTCPPAFLGYCRNSDLV